MTVDSKPVCENVSDDWLALDCEASEPGRRAVIAWCEHHAALILIAANMVLWSAVACGFHFG